MLSPFLNTNHINPDTYQYKEPVERIYNHKLNESDPMTNSQRMINQSENYRDKEISIQNLDTSNYEASPIINKEVFRQIIYENSQSEDPTFSQRESKNNNLITSNFLPTANILKHSSLYTNEASIQEEDLNENFSSNSRSRKLKYMEDCKDPEEKSHENSDSFEDTNQFNSNPKFISGDRVTKNLSREENILDLEIAALEEFQRTNSDPEISKLIKDKINSSLII